MKFFNFLKNNIKSIRVKTSIGDKFINVKLGQTYESMDILSLKIFQKDLYRLFDADYGIIVGRVTGQDVGVPNAKVSIFIPLNEENIPSPINLEDIKKIETASLYPYQTVFDKDGNGKVYNLLPKYSRNRNFNGFPDNDFGIGATPKTPVGSFPEKDEVLVNETVAYLYENYLKFTTVTNESGDYILTVPANKTYNINMSCDITDVGKFSTTPALLKLEGYPENFFSQDGTIINDTIPLELLPNIDIQNQSITVKPLWTQNENNTNVGINRLDFKLNKKLKPYTTVIGNYFTQNKSSWWGDRIVFRMIMGLRSICLDLGGCPPGDPSGAFFQVRFAILIRLCVTGVPVIPDFNFTIVKWDNFGNSYYNEDCGFRMCFLLYIKYALPFFNFAFFKRKFCTLRGGKAEYEPWDMRFVRVAACTRSQALQSLGGELTDSLFIQRHDKGLVDIRVFSIKNNITDQECDILNNAPESDTVTPSNYNIDGDIELLPENKYVKYINDGNFVILLPSNRRKVITNEEGSLIEVPFDYVTGVFTEFRGYFIIKHLDEVNNPPTRDRTGKIMLKVPQFFDYRKNVYLWIFKHYKFDYGQIYSVSQYNGVRYADYGRDWEGSDDDAINPGNKGWDEQTNILFTAAFDLPNLEPLPGFYVPKPNAGGPGMSEDIEYTSFYNHITYLGRDAPIEGINDDGGTNTPGE